jgi:lysosomal Pro-X carboxypeptidase
MQLLSVVLCVAVISPSHVVSPRRILKTHTETRNKESQYRYETAWFNQTLDHFAFTTNATFPQKYLYNDTWWDKDEPGPIFFYTGNEGIIEAFAENSGFMWDIAPEFKALLVFAEHRYYGESLPFGGKIGKDASKVGYLTSEQALADYAQLINYIKIKNPSAVNSPVIAFGGSYGGMLAAWFRMKYPHVCAGAIAASAPVAQFTSPCDAFGRIVTSDYTAAVSNGTCSQNIRKSWAALDRLANQTNNTGLDWINKNWKLCSPFTQASNVSVLKNYLNEMWTNIAMMDYPYPTSFLVPLPGNPVNAVCSKLEGVYSTDEELITHIFEATSIYFNYTGAAKCLNLAETDDIGADMWNYQACSEMVMPFCYDGVNDMFEASKWDVRQFSKDCLRDWNVVPRPNMANLMYGGRNLDAASNIVFSNGLLDPWSSGGILKTHGTVVTVIIPEGAHHLDLRASNPADPESVISARKTEKKYIRKWITMTNRNLKRKSYLIS